MSLDCTQCSRIFVNLGLYEDTWFSPDVILTSAALGCEICSILRRALERLANLSPDDQVNGPENRRILQGAAKITRYGTLVPSGRVRSGAYEFLFYYLPGIDSLFHIHNLSFTAARPMILLRSEISVHRLRCPNLRLLRDSGSEF
jgi:hypothetical protein